MDVSTKVTISKYMTYACLGVTIYSVIQIVGTLGYDKPRAELFLVVLIVSNIVGLVAAICKRYFKSLSINKNYDAITIETLVELGKRMEKPLK